MPARPMRKNPPPGPANMANPSKSTMRIIALDPCHAPSMTALHRESFSPAWPEHDMQQHLARDLVLGYEMEGGLRGFIILALAADQADILILVVHHDARQRGIGQALLAAAENKAYQQGVRTVFLDVAEDNIPALRLYQNSGYQPIGRRPAYYRRAHGRIAALTFCKTLTFRQEPA